MKPVKERIRIMDPFGLEAHIIFGILFGLAIICIIGYFISVYKIMKLEDELRRIEEIRDWLEPNRNSYKKEIKLK